MSAPKVSLWQLIKSDLACVKSRDPAARSGFETVLCYPGFHAIAIHRVCHTLWKRGWKLPARLLSHFARVLTAIDIHPGAVIGSGFFIDHGCGVVIGETAVVGDDCTLYHQVTLGGVSWSPGRRHPSLGDSVLVGAGAKVLGPIEVGNGARVGANSVVVEDVPPNMTVVGIPARVVNRERPAAMNDADRMRVDLDHHLMPDPAARVIERLADRIGFLEARVARLAGSVRDDEPCCADPIDAAGSPQFKGKPGENHQTRRSLTQ